MVVAGAGLVDTFIHSFAPSASMSPALAVMLGAQRMVAGGTTELIGSQSLRPAHSVK